MAIDMKQVKGLKDELNNKADKSDLELLEALQTRISELENRLNTLTDNGNIVSMSINED